MLPEISRRCRSCGAAVRAGARFCPQCGKLMEGPATPSEAGDGTPETRAAESPREWAPPTREFSAFVESLEGGGQRAEASETAVSPAPEPQAAPAAEDVPVQAGDRSYPAAMLSPAAGEDATAVEGDAQGADAGEARGRVARVREGARSRVEKIRDEAVVVLEETPDDSGLRFVVAAAALFLLFLLLFILSITVLR